MPVNRKGETSFSGLRSTDPAGSTKKSAAPRIPVGLDRGMEKQECVHARIVPRPDHAAERAFAAVQPKDVAVDDPKGLGAQRLERIGDAAAGIQKLRLAREHELGVAAAAEVGLDLVAEMVEVEDDRLDAGLDKPVDAPVHDGPAAHRDQGLRRRFGERAHARPLAGGEDHGARWSRLDCRGAAPRRRLAHLYSAAVRHGGTLRCREGRWQSIQSLTAASAGCASERSRSRQTRGMCAR